VPGWQRHQVDGALVEAADLCAPPRVVLVVVVRAGDELGQARGPTRQQEDGDVVAPWGGLVEPGARGLRVVGRLGQAAQVGAVGPGRHAEDEDGPHRVHLGGHLVRHRLVVDVLDAVGHDHRCHLGVRGEVAQLVAPVRRQRHDRRHPETQAGEGQDDVLPAVRELHEHDAAWGQTEIAETLGQAVGAGGELAVGQADIAVDKSDSVRVLVGPAPQERPERLAPPEAALPVLLRHLRRPGHDARAHHRLSHGPPPGRPGRRRPEP
jgi:hypothetical protein